MRSEFWPLLGTPTSLATKRFSLTSAPTPCGNFSFIIPRIPSLTLPIDIEMNVMSMDFQDNTFDCVINKATMDALLCGEGSLMNT